MFIPRSSYRLSVVLSLTSVMWFATSANGQAFVPQPSSPDKQVAAAQGPRPINAEKKVAEEGPRTSSLEDEVAAVKADNAAVREQLRKMEEQQRTLLDMLDRLQRRLDGSTVAEAPRATQPPSPAQGAEASATAAAQPSVTSLPAPPAQADPKDSDRYQDGIILVRTSEQAKVPFLMRFN